MPDVRFVWLAAALSWGVFASAQVTDTATPADEELPTEIPEELLQSQTMEEIEVIVGPQGENLFELDAESPRLRFVPVRKKGRVDVAFCETCSRRRLVRTESEAPKHAGISYLLVPMDQDGVEVRPILQMTGDAEFCEVFFNDARAAVGDVVGGVNGSDVIYYTSVAGVWEWRDQLGNNNIGNSYAVAAQVQSFGGVPVLLGVARDQESLVRQGCQAWTSISPSRDSFDMPCSRR